MLTLRIPLLLGLLIALAACATRVEPPWPADAPARSIFVAEWQASTNNHDRQSEADYLMWVERFYVGYSGVPGWLDMTRQVLERLPPEDRVPAAARLAELGARIGGEWAKDNAVRRVNSRAAAVWRDALLEALARDELEQYLEILAADVAALLAGDLSGDAIHFERYYVDEFDF